MAAAANLARTKRAMAYALCKHLNVDPNTVSHTSIEESDIESLFPCIVKSPQDEVLKWVKFASDFAGNDGKQHTLVANLNQDLSQKSVILGDGLKPSVADIVVFATVQAFMSLLKDNELQKYPHVLRWMDYIQNVVDFGTTLQKINIMKSVFNPPSHPKKADKGDTESSLKKIVSGQKIADKSNGSAVSKKAAGESKAPAEAKENLSAAKNNKPSGDKKKVQATEKAAEKAPEKTAEKDSECNVSILNIQVGLIRKASASVLRSPSSSRRRIGVSLRAVAPGPQGLVGRDHAPRGRRLVAALAGEEEASEVRDDKDNINVEIQPEEAQEAWKVMLEQFKADALRMQALSMQAYKVYSKRTREVLLEASQKLKIQAEKAQKDLSVIAAEVGEEGQEYLRMAAQKSPDSINDITDTFSALSKLTFLSQYKDYHVGIPFGTFLSAGGFLDFMLTGHTSALRFGIILGLALLAMSISSLRTQRDGRRQPRLLLKGQTAIATVIFFRELSALPQNGWFPKIFVVLLSGTATAFYFYRIATGNTPKISEQ